MERIAIVDDEKIVLSLTGRMLETLGYKTLSFDTTSRFVKSFSAEASEIDLLVTDLTMPGTSGLELTRRLREAGHDLPVLIMTGYSKHLRPGAVSGLGRIALLKKPFTRDHLGQAVRRLLSGYADE